MEEGMKGNHGDGEGSMVENEVRNGTVSTTEFLSTSVIVFTFFCHFHPCPLRGYPYTFS